LLHKDYDVYGSVNLYCDSNDLSSLSIFNSANDPDDNPVKNREVTKAPAYSVLLEYDLFENEDCSSDNDVSKFYAFYNDHCFNYDYYLDTVLVTISYKYSFPYYYTYSAHDCDSNSLVNKYSLESNCYNVITDDYIKSDDDDDDDDDDVYNGSDDEIYLGFRQKWIFTGSAIEKKDRTISLIVIIVVTLLATMTTISLVAYFFGDKLMSLIRGNNGIEPVQAIISVTQVEAVPHVEVSHQFIQSLPHDTNDNVVVVAKPISLSSLYSPPINTIIPSSSSSSTTIINNRRNTTVVVSSGNEV
jgi:hypothetical protein